MRGGGLRKAGRKAEPVAKRRTRTKSRCSSWRRKGRQAQETEPAGLRSERERERRREKV